MQHPTHGSLSTQSMVKASSHMQYHSQFRAPPSMSTNRSSNTCLPAAADAPLVHVRRSRECALHQVLAAHRLEHEACMHNGESERHATPAATLLVRSHMSEASVVARMHGSAYMMMHAAGSSCGA